MRVYIAKEAEADLEEIADFIALENPTRAISFAAELHRKAVAIGRSPRIYRIRPELGPDWRAAVYRPYVIIFRINGKQVEVLRFLHGARDLPAILRGDR